MTTQVPNLATSKVSRHRGKTNVCTAPVQYLKLIKGTDRGILHILHLFMTHNYVIAQQVHSLVKRTSSNSPV